MELADQIKIFLGDFSSLAPRIKHLNYETEICGDRIDLRCSYISFRDDQQTFDDFISVLYKNIISFSIPRKNIIENQRLIKEDIEKDDIVSANTRITQLQETARSLFMRAQKGSHRSGEAGEILLYILTQWILSAPQIVSKMYLKTNNNMPVHGTDGIHAKYDESTNKLLLYWGESKAHKTLSSAFSDAMESISEFLEGDQQDYEINLVSEYSDFATATPESRAAFLDFLDPYSENSNNRITHFACLLVFQKPAKHSEDPTTEEKYVQEINKKMEKFISSLKDKVESRNLNGARFEFFVFPVPSVEEFRDKFQAKIGWPK